MEQQQLQHYLRDYFTWNNCSIIHDQQGILTVQLTEELDEELMNRPFYWNYVKRMGKRGIPQQLTIVTDPEQREEKKGEWIHFGSPRLHKIFRSTMEKARTTRVYEQLTVEGSHTPLTPWLNVNVILHYQGAQKKNELLSLGLQLVHGSLLTNFMDRLDGIPLKSTINDYCFTLTPMIRPQSGFRRMESYLNDYVTKQETDWAKQSLLRLHEEKKLLHHFYSDYLQKETAMEDEELQLGLNRYQQELLGLEERFSPQITVEMVNCGLVYLSHESSTTVMKP
ncbi:hypothetical protein N781_05810 [Pontibacillus halophilus JSM 076056 = DSM 19796]|uniref:YqhG n=1 Tax=Pontibacillus halophilus JSM 076056 = DSM 19796 TaxID=1385510 RepID=A0A0A5I4X4_9BACI|nr:YqhG family protein [Pontibacillus halophilus]KGX90882.1 hypothetical protein N781_05810 [Pontibacillus halophilus JSM 076056 = DSM 19796]